MTAPPSLANLEEDAALFSALEDLVQIKIIRLAEMVGRSGARAFEQSFGIRYTEVRIFVLLAASGPLSTNEISRRLRIDKAWISRSIAELAGRGLLAREPGGKGRHLPPVGITDEGAALLKRIAPVALERQRQIMGELTQADFDRVLGVLLRGAEGLGVEG